MKIIKEQIEYYLGDVNLSRDKFFREQIETNKEGWVNIAHFLNCNKVKQLKITAADISAACVDSDQVEISTDKLKVRRSENKALPAAQEQRKRDAKFDDKAPKKKDEGVDDYDEKTGKVILTERDFSDPIIVYYNTTIPEGEEFKVNWKEVEAKVKEAYPKLKLIYSRGGQNDGHMAFSSLRLNQELFDTMTTTKMTVEDHEFTFCRAEDDCLKDFWQDHGNHYSFCTQNRVRFAKKQAKAKMMEKRESVKRAKTSFEIAGAIYLDIGKVKSKSRAILNLKKDGERLTGNDEAFMKDIIEFHARHE